MNKTLAISIIAALALSTLGMAIWVKSSRDRIAELEKAIGPYQVLQMDLGNASPEDVVDAFKNMEDSLMQMQMMYDTLSTDNTEMMARIEEQKAQIASLISKAKSRDYDIKKLVAETQTLRNIMKGYIQQIDSLQQANDRLYAESQDAKLKATEAENRSKELESDLTQTKEQVKTGAVLSTGGFVNSGIRERISGAETTTDRAAKASMLKSSFTLRENKLAKPGLKTIYMKIIDANGNVWKGWG
jgi:chromosome segregation ATPase